MVVFPPLTVTTFSDATWPYVLYCIFEKICTLVLLTVVAAELKAKFITFTTFTQFVNLPDELYCLFAEKVWVILVMGGAGVPTRVSRASMLPKSVILSLNVCVQVVLSKVPELFLTVS